jgi:hypothetical protein
MLVAQVAMDGLAHEETANEKRHFLTISVRTVFSRCGSIGQSHRWSK